MQDHFVGSNMDCSLGSKMHYTEQLGALLLDNLVHYISHAIVQLVSLENT
jgi:hypothetical protein